MTWGRNIAHQGTRRSSGWVGVIALIATLAMTQLACTDLLAQPAPPLVRAVISGTVYGDRLADQQAGKSVAVPLQATVRCNAASVATKADGSYSLSVAQASQYACAASAPTYSAGQTILVGSLGPLFHLDFGGPIPVATCGAPATTPTSSASPGATSAVRAPTTSTTAAATASAGARSGPSAVLECPELHLVVGSVAGTVTQTENQAPADGVRLTCWNPHGTPGEDLAPTGTYQTQTDAQGAFSFAGLPVDRYLCTAGSDPNPAVMSPSPGVTTTVAIHTCGKHCPPVTYQGGLVMHSFTAYLVFWLPSGHMYSVAGDAHFEGLIQRYFRDVGGSAYYNVVTQYWDTASGFILNQVALGDVYVDAHPYPHAGTSADPLTTSDIEREVQSAFAVRNWTNDATHAVFVYTAYGAEICDGGTGGLCTYPNGSQQVFCGYHSITSENLIFAEIADTPSCVKSAYLAPYDSPNGDRLADEALITTSHEQFEAATDPDTHGWWERVAATGEIGDKCQQSYREVTLGGHPYWVQPEWSDRDNSCVYGL